MDDPSVQSPPIVAREREGTLRAIRLPDRSPTASGGGPDHRSTHRNGVVVVGDRLIRASVAGGADALTVGVATPGIVDAAHRRIVALPGKLAGLEGLDWGDALRARLPPTLTGTIAVLNDAHAAVPGEARLGAGRGTADVAMLTLGTGVGGGVMIGGSLFEGPNRGA